ncbi:30S ribosomal protein S20 [Candidatus Gracilibacteria bacterium]|nr:30S ribosomal protein S20 [Candidatus Gracilibacteria bacterium]MCF7819672.1 30S ribosomal protein S20 [Candidatus Gracilibacteria bacterium]
MPIIKSAIKRVRQEKTRRIRNNITKKTYKSLIKEFENLVSEKKLDDAAKLYPQLQKALDLAVKKNILHANNVGRKKSRLAKMLEGKATPQVKATEKKAKSGAKKKNSTAKKKTSAKKTTKKSSTAKKTTKK